VRFATSAIGELYARGTTTMATALRIVRPDGAIYAFHTHDEDKVVDGVTYSSDPGLVAGEINIASGLDVGNLEMRTLHDGTIFTPADIFGGLWKNSAFLIFRYNWQDPDAGTDDLLGGNFGEVLIEQNMVVAELLDLRLYLQHPVGDFSSKTCPYRFGDARCGKSLSDNTVTSTITHVSNGKLVFRDSSRAEPEDWFGWGTIHFESGDAEGVTARIESYAANGTFTLSIPLFVNVQIGDAYTAVAGCRGRLEEDCRDKHDNVRRFGGQPHRRGLDNVTASPDADV